MFTPILTVLALTAFAANSLLCRMALGGDLADPVSFTVVRLVSGAVVLLPIAGLVREPSQGGAGRQAGSWTSSVALFVYALAFSLAYVSLDTGVGALILFGAVQATMIGVGLATGERPGVAEWVGLVVAIGGLAYLVSPGLAAPDPAGAVLMAAAGVAWGIYSLRGRTGVMPVATTAGNFLRAAILSLPVGVLALSAFDLQATGAALAVTSGGLTSGLGYVLWYRALRGLTATTAAIVQLLVPVLAATAGVALLAETVSTRFVVASALILGGVAVAVATRGSARTGSSDATW